MSRIQDVFGASPTTVLNKPFAHVRHTTASGVNGGASSVGDNKRSFNTVVTDEIGVTLSSGGVSLPAGKYYVIYEGQCYDASSFYAYGSIRAGSVELLRGVNRRISAGSSNSIQARGYITLSTAAVVDAYQVHGAAEASSGLGPTDDQNADGNVYAELLIWKLDSTVETTVLSDPTMVLARPLMWNTFEVTSSGSFSMATGTRTVDLNTTRVNEISGASRSGNDITLPAGTYEISAIVMTHAKADGDGSIWIADASDDSELTPRVVYARSYTAVATWRLPLTEATTIRLRLLQDQVTGISYAIAGDIIYDLQIRQLDAVIRTPVLVNDKLYPLPGSTIVTGNMHGLEYAYTTANSITVQPGICMDSTNQEVLSLSSATVVSIGTTVNEVYNLFICKAGSTVTIQTDTDVDGANLSAQDYIRWIGFVTTNSSGDIIDFYQSGDLFTFKNGYQNAVITTGTSSLTLLDASSLAPLSRCESKTFGIRASIQCSGRFATISGGTDVDTVDTMVYMYAVDYKTASPEYPAGASVYASASSGTGTFYLISVKLRR